MKLTFLTAIAAATLSAATSTELPRTSIAPGDSLSLADTVSLCDYRDEFLARDLDFLRVPGAVVGELPVRHGTAVWELLGIHH